MGKSAKRALAFLCVFMLLYIQSDILVQIGGHLLVEIYWKEWYNDTINNIGTYPL